MTRSKSPGQVPTAEVVAYYRRRVEGGVGLIVTEGTVIDHPASDADAGCRFYGADALAGWAGVVKGRSRRPAATSCRQIWHVGTARRQAAARHPDALSSALRPLAAGQAGEPAAGRERDRRSLAAYASVAAADARRLGRRGRAARAHGYLIDQFFWGGDQPAHRRLRQPDRPLHEVGADVVRAVRAARSRLPADPALVAVEAAGLRRQAGGDA